MLYNFFGRYLLECLAVANITILVRGDSVAEWHSEKINEKGSLPSLGNISSLSCLIENGCEPSRLVDPLVWIPPYSHGNVSAGHLQWREGLSTVDLLFKKVCFVIKKTFFYN